MEMNIYIHKIKKERQGISMIKVDIISGFLGAGKTTLIKKLVEEKLSSQKIVIIENEFGEVGIDGSILRKSNMEVKEISAGCICCTINEDFKIAVEEVMDKYAADQIIIEPSGVAKISEILKILNVPDLKKKIKLNMIITIVDVLKYKIYISNFEEFYRNQITNANTIILSRTQNARSEQVEEVMDDIKKINKEANIITTPWSKLSAERIIEISEQSTKAFIDEQVNLIKKPQGRFSLQMHKSKTYKGNNADESFTTWSIETAKVFNKQHLINKLQQIGDTENYGVVLRAKGIIKVDENQWIQFDYVKDEIKIEATSPDYTGRLCVIGSNLDEDNIKELLLS